MTRRQTCCPSEGVSSKLTFNPVPGRHSGDWGRSMPTKRFLSLISSRQEDWDESGNEGFTILKDGEALDDVGLRRDELAEAAATAGPPSLLRQHRLSAQIWAG